MKTHTSLKDAQRQQRFARSASPSHILEVRNADGSTGYIVVCDCDNKGRDRPPEAIVRRAQMFQGRGRYPSSIEKIVERIA